MKKIIFIFLLVIIFIVGCSPIEDKLEQDDCIPNCVNSGKLPRDCAKECGDLIEEGKPPVSNDDSQDDCILKCVQTGKLPRDCAKECDECDLNQDGEVNQVETNICNNDKPPIDRSNSCVEECLQEGGKPRECIQGCDSTSTSKPNQENELSEFDLPSFSTEDGFFLGFSSTEDPELALLKESGATWVRRNRWYKDDINFILQGIPTDVLAENKINIINTIEPLGSWVPKDYSLFKEKLAELIESEKDYVKYWQLGNEPDLIWERQGNTEEDYINFFLELQPIIRETCSDCKIILAGISNQYDSGDNYDYFKTILREIKKRSLDQKPFDVFDLHFYPIEGGYYDAEKAPIDYKNLLEETGYDYEIELINTELGVYSGKPLVGISGKPLNIPEIVFITEQQQAHSLIKTYTMLFNGGLTKIMWTQLVNAHQHGYDNENEGGLWDLMGIVYNGLGSYDIENNIAPETKKESFYSYLVMAEKIQGKTKSEKIADYVYRFSGNGEVYIAWNDDGGNLPSLISGNVLVTDYLGNEEVKDSNDVVLTESPIFIEVI